MNMRDRTEVRAARRARAASLSERQNPDAPAKKKASMTARPALMGPPETPATPAALALPETDTEEPAALM